MSGERRRAGTQRGSSFRRLLHVEDGGHVHDVTRTGESDDVRVWNGGFRTARLRGTEMVRGEGCCWGGEAIPECTHSGREPKQCEQGTAGGCANTAVYYVCKSAGPGGTNNSLCNPNGETRCKAPKCKPADSATLKTGRKYCIPVTVPKDEDPGNP